jgi:hypothetical protein
MLTRESSIVEMRSSIWSVRFSPLISMTLVHIQVCPTRYSDAFYKSMLDPSLDDINKLSKFVGLVILSAIISNFVDSVTRF